METQLILASSSRYRKALLDRLKISYQCLSPDINETPLSGETPTVLVERLALQKAQTIQATNPAATIIGSDQASVNGGKILGKPHTRDNAIQQLQNASGKSVAFLTSLAVISPNLSSPLVTHVATTVHFRDLSLQDIQRYVDAENALDCAGSFKSEGLGVSLFSKVDTSDLTALEGLPLIKTCDFLRQAGFLLP